MIRDSFLVMMANESGTEVDIFFFYYLLLFLPGWVEEEEVVLVVFFWGGGFELIVCCLKNIDWLGSLATTRLVTMCNGG